MALSDYLAALKRQKWVVLVVILITTASAVYFSSRQTPTYAAQGQVLLNPNQQLTTGAGSSASDAQARYDATQAEVAHTPAVTAIALTTTPVRGETPGSIVSMSTVSADASSNILTFTVRNVDPQKAKEVVNAYITAFTVYSHRLDTVGIQKALAALSGQISSLTKEINAAKTSNSPVAGQREQLHGLVRKQQQLKELELLQTGGATVSKLATGAYQVSPEPKRDAALGVLLGLVIGLGLGFVREALDSRVRTTAEISTVLGLPLLARLPTPPRALRSADRLAMLSEKHQASYGEGYRQLRVALDFANLAAPAKAVMVTSAVAQEGKSTTVSNLAIALARAGRRVVLVDLDERSPYLERFFGLKGHAGITNVALGGASLSDALVDIPIAAPSGSSQAGLTPSGDAGELRVLVAGALPPDPSEFMETPALGRILAELEGLADIVLVDAPPLLAVSDAATLSRSVGALIVVVQSKLVTRPILGELRRMLEICPARKLGFVLTGAEHAEGYGYGYGYGSANQHLADSGRQGAEHQGTPHGSPLAPVDPRSISPQ